MPKFSIAVKVIEYEECRFDNGLQVLVSRERWSKMGAVNVVYRVGSVNERAERTGLAHLFEHLMFRGTRRVPDFDRRVQEVCGEGNAFTTADYTDFYTTLPNENIETALWLEADRMRGLELSPKNIAVEKSVVCEEFNQRFINQPYGDKTHLLRSMVYTVHPYRWPTIGLSIDDICNASADEVKAFHERYYTPSNAILSIVSDLEPQAMIDLARRRFGKLPSAPAPHDEFTVEPPQTSPRRIEVSRSNIAADQITIAFPMAGRIDAAGVESYNRDYYLADFLTDLLAGGESARIYRSLVKEQRLFSAVNAYITGEVQSGMLILTGELLDGVDISRGEQALWGELRNITAEPPSAYECEKVKNKFEANTAFGELNVMNKAMNLGYYKFIDNIALLNGETAIYRSIEASEIVDYVERNLTVERSSTLIYHREQ